MTQRQVAPYGSWKSPIQARQIAAGTVRLSEVMLDGEWVWWLELRPAEGGRCVVVRLGPDGRPVDMTPVGFNTRTRVHEYGGGSYLPCGNAVVFANFADQRLYRYTGEGEPTPVTPAGDVRYADFVCDKPRSRLISVCEDHSARGEAVNTIAAIYPHESRPAETLVSGNDFYSSPRLSPDGAQLAWLTWNHPDMPWDAAELRVAPVREDGSLGEAARVAGGTGESIAQPRWSPDGVLHFASDRTNWWNLCRWRDGKVEPLTRMEAEFASPAWVFRMSNYGFDGPDTVICAYFQSGLGRLARLDTRTGALEPIETPYNAIGSVRAGGGRAVFIAAAADRPPAVVRMDLATGRIEELRRATELSYEAGYVSPPEPVEFATAGGLTAHGLFYAPASKDYAAPTDETPPLVVMVHGGPTSATTGAFNPRIQFYTSRGIAVLDVNYGGSSGYGRAYRNRLRGQWGVVDVDDCCNGARHLIGRGLVDPRRVAITGGSAGGYTTLAALAFRDVFKAGASHFGVSDCEALAKETHKFESRYLDGLIGPYPQRRDLYVERSPIHHLDGFNCPIAFFQGLEDRIVPPNQAQMMVDALRAKGIPVAYVEFPGEQHGFRKADNIRRALEGELYFLGRIFGFAPADEIEPLDIENLTGP
ncbi:MAG TPA: S9 family peptidase [Phycisphaerae bacterium]|nr:S9 family peptidase [Phycisphaerae bacterium]